MDEMNKNMGSGTTDRKQGEKGSESQDEIKIWKRPDNGRKKRYVYEVVTEEPEEKGSEAVKDDGYYRENVPGSEADADLTPEEGENLKEAEPGTDSSSGPEAGPQQESGAEETADHSKKRGLFSGKRADRQKKPEKKTETGKSGSGSKNNPGNRNKKKENLLEKDNISKKARQEFWKQQVVEGNPDHRSFMARMFQGLRRYGKRIAAIVLIVSLVFGVTWYYDRNRKYHSYDVEWQISASDNGYSEYMTFNDAILYYSQDGVSCINQNGEVMWNQAFNMDVPGIAAAGDYVVIYDIKGTSLYICDKNGCTGSAETKKKILKADISENGVTAVVLDDKNCNYVNYFRKDGSQIDLEIKTLISGDGYPLDIAISPDGTQLITSYVYEEGGSMMNQVVFRNFEVGKNNADRVVGGFRQYKETLVPEVIFFDNQNSAAITEMSIDFYSTRNAMSPELAKTQELNSRIKTVFYNDEYVGVILEKDEKVGKQEETGAEDETRKVEATADEGSSEEETKQAIQTAYTMLVFDKTGAQTFEQTIDFEYSYADFSGDGIVVYNNSECAVYNITGVCKYQEQLDMNIDGVMRFTENSLVIRGNGALRKLTLK
ncbi:MAG: DUF5711 family protein [Lachnospiraceae bacterium]